MLQAQVEAYADKAVAKFSDDQKMLLQYSEELSRITDLDNLPNNLPQELIELIGRHKDAYTAFMRNEGRVESEFVARNQRVYDDLFKQPIDVHRRAFEARRLERGDMFRTTDLRDLPGYAGSGSNSSTFRIEVGGKKYAAKFVRDNNPIPTNLEIKALLRAHGVPNVSQFVAYSFKDATTVMEFLPGTEMTEYPAETIPEITTSDIKKLIETVFRLDSLGLSIDPKPSNFLYDPSQGFSILDYHLKGAKSSAAEQSTLWLETVLTTCKMRDLPNFDDPAYPAALEKLKKDIYALQLPNRVRFLRECRVDFPKVFDLWSTQRETERQKDRSNLKPLVRRELLDEYPHLEPYLEELEQMGIN